MRGLLQPTLNNACVLPVPTGYVQSQIHPSIIIIPEQWNGYSHWMASTPWGSNDEENPCIYYANYNSDGSHPTVFTALASNPIIPKPSGINDYNADCELIFDKSANGGAGRMYMFWKDTSIIKDGVKTGGWRRVQSDDGVTWTDNTIVKYDLSVSLFHAFFNDKLYCWFIRSSANSIWGDTAVFRSFESFSFTDYSDINFLNPPTEGGAKLKNKYQIWHAGAFSYNDTVYMLANAYPRGVSANTQTFLYYSTDGINFIQYSNKPFCAFLRPYRPSCFLDGQKLVIYQAVRDLPTTNPAITENGMAVCKFEMDIDEFLDIMK